MVHQISNVAGTTFRVGDRVRHHIDGWTGTITSIAPDSVRCLFVTPDNEGDVPAFMRWPLNADAARSVGRATYCAPRDTGMSMGSYEKIARCQRAA